jgi:hypothetical protein
MVILWELPVESCYDTKKVGCVCFSVQEMADIIRFYRIEITVREKRVEMLQ